MKKSATAKENDKFFSAVTRAMKRAAIRPPSGSHARHACLPLGKWQSRRKETINTIPSRMILGNVKERAVHVVAAYNAGDDEMIVIAVDENTVRLSSFRPEPLEG